MVLKLRDIPNVSIYCFVTALFDMELKLRGRLTFKVHGFVTVLFDMGLKHKLYIMHLLGVFFILRQVTVNLRLLFFHAFAILKS